MCPRCGQGTEDTAPHQGVWAGIPGSIPAPALQPNSCCCNYVRKIKPAASPWPGSPVGSPFCISHVSCAHNRAGAAGSPGHGPRHWVGSGAGHAPLSTPPPSTHGSKPGKGRVKPTRLNCSKSVVQNTSSIMVLTLISSLERRCERSHILALIKPIQHMQQQW